MPPMPKFPWKAGKKLWPGWIKRLSLKDNRIGIFFLWYCNLTRHCHAKNSAGIRGAIFILENVLSFTSGNLLQRNFWNIYITIEKTPENSSFLSCRVKKIPNRLIKLYIFTKVYFNGSVSSYHRFPFPNHDFQQRIITTVQVVTNNKSLKTSY